MHIIIPVIAALAVWAGIIAVILRGLHNAARVRDRIDAMIADELRTRLIGLAADAAKRGDIAAANQYSTMARDLARQNTMHNLEQTL
ncbi:MAG: hypothetical protein E7J90_08910 [Cutibacterium avidum]|nr:hypothetical protein [Cutibacterium avidum]